jgi:3,4-dihydroxy 2-butanone 4-phosphate synthase/GTP cyclohydrolase II
MEAAFFCVYYLLLLFASIVVTSCDVIKEETTSETNTPKNDVDNNIQDIVDQIRGWQRQAPPRTRPFLTASFAQSLDGKIAIVRDDGSKSSNYQLSGNDSMRLTHALRSIHDGILIGGNTLLIDNPRLTNRLWGGKSPRQIILDSHLNHVTNLAKKCRLDNPIICCCEDAAALSDRLLISAQLLVCTTTKEGRLDLHDALKKLKLHYGIESILVEGGSDVLGSVFQMKLVDALCITVAPKFLGSPGISPIFLRKDDQPINLVPESSRYLVLGQDAILVSRMPGSWRVDKITDQF